MNINDQIEWGVFSANTSLPVQANNLSTPFWARRVVKIPISMIDSNPAAARRHFDEVAILALAHSIKKHGLLQPILVKKNGKGVYEKGRYTCIAGERRLRAHKMLGREEIFCFVLSANLPSADELTMVENLAREDLNMFEYAATFASVMQQHALSENQLAQELSTSEINVKNKLSLLAFSEDEQVFILSQHLSERHALALLRIEDPVLRQKVTSLVAERQYTAKRTEDYVDVILSDLLPNSELLDANDDADLFGNSLNCSMAMLHRKGVAAECERFEHEDEVQFLVRIPKK